MRRPGFDRKPNPNLNPNPSTNDYTRHQNTKNTRTRTSQHSLFEFEFILINTYFESILKKPEVGREWSPSTFLLTNDF